MCVREVVYGCVGVGVVGVYGHVCERWWCMDVCESGGSAWMCVFLGGGKRVYMCGYGQDVNSDNYSCAYSKSAIVCDTVYLTANFSYVVSINHNF